MYPNVAVVGKRPYPSQMKWMLQRPTLYSLVCLHMVLLHYHATAQAADNGAAQITRKVLVWQLSSLGVDPEMAHNLEGFLRNSVSTMPNMRVVSVVDLNLALSKPKNKALKSCTGGPQCAAKMGRLVGAEVVVFGSIGGMGTAFSLSLVAVDPKTAKVVAKKRANVSGSRDLLIPGVRLAAFGLLAPELIKGALRVDVQASAVSISIDGVKVAETPFSGVVEGIAPGKHKVELTKSGFAAFSDEVVIKPFETTRLKVELKK